MNDEMYRIHMRYPNGGKELGWYLGVQKEGKPLCSQGVYSGKQYRTEREALLDIVPIEEDYIFMLFKGDLFIASDKTMMFGMLDVPKPGMSIRDDKTRQDVKFFF